MPKSYINIYIYTGVPETFDSFKERKLRRQSCFKFRNKFMRLINRIYVS